MLFYFINSSLKKDRQFFLELNVVPETIIAIT